MAVPEITVQEASRLLASQQPPRLIDVREPEEWAVCHLPAAELLPLSQWPAIAEQRLLDRHEALLIQCHHGVRSARAAEFLQSHGYTNVANLAGGIDAWSIEIDSTIPRYGAGL